MPPIVDPRVVVGYNNSDDAAVVRMDGDKALVQTVDFFTPIVDDPYDFGQIAAANSLSDIYAMGGKPLFALNIVGFPIQTLPRKTLTEILFGGADKAKEAGISIVGGHTVDDKEPKYGLVVTGEIHVPNLVRNSTAGSEDVLVLTKPLGTGIIATAIKKGIADSTMIRTATDVMKTLNSRAAELMLKHKVHAATDVTGYGLLGHLLEMCRGSNVSAEIEFHEIQFIEGVINLAQQGIIPGGTKRNLNFVEKDTKFDSGIEDYRKLMAADAQTSGGLLLAFSESDADTFLEEFNQYSSILAFKIGRIVPRKDRSIFLA